MKACHRCGRWFEPRPPQKHAAASSQPPLPLDVLSLLPAAREAWSRMDHRSSTSTASFAVPHAPGVKDTERKNNNPFAPVSDDDDNDDDDDENATTETRCGLPDCSAGQNSSHLRTDTARAAANIAEQRWDFSVVCSCCGRVYPCPVPHPSSFLSNSTASLSAPASSLRRASFVCADYPAPWREALVSLKSNNSSQQQRTPSSSVQPSPASVKSAKNTKHQQDNWMMICPSMLLVNTTATTASTQQQEHKLVSPPCSVAAKLPVPGLIASGFSCVFSAAGHQQPHVAALSFVDGGLPAQEKLRETMKRNRESNRILMARLELAQSKNELPPTPTVLSARNSGGQGELLNDDDKKLDVPKQQQSHQPQPSSAKTQLALSMRANSVVVARSGLVGVADAAIAGVVAGTITTVTQEKAAQRRQQNQQQPQKQKQKQKPQQQQPEKELPKRRGRSAVAAADSSVATTAPQHPPNSANAAAAATTKTIPATTTIAAAAAAAEQQQQQEQQQEDQANIHWQTCDKCSKWRVLGCQEQERAKFHCSDLGDGTTCADPSEGKVSIEKQKILRRKRKAVWEAAQKKE